ncbi:MAG TPA: hypothetical protein VHO28_00920 [Ignavibacteriales bacterium]|nr:hypothetical protein [Ignavibacteriales bacterium]
MKKFLFLYLAVLLIPLFGQEKLAGKTAGVIFTKEEADSLFGSVLSSFEMSSKELSSYLSKTDSYMLFHYDPAKSKTPFIFDNSKSVMNMTAMKIEMPEELKVYSVSQIKELMEKGGQETTRIEQREGVISITNGEYTLEMSLDCPPFCP